MFKATNKKFNKRKWNKTFKYSNYRKNKSREKYSTNAILRDNKAEVKQGEHWKMETKCYKNDFIRIYDTRGIEISKDFDIEKVLMDIKRYKR